MAGVSGVSSIVDAEDDKGCWRPAGPASEMNWRGRRFPHSAFSPTGKLQDFRTTLLPCMPGCCRPHCGRTLRRFGDSSLHATHTSRGVHVIQPVYNVTASAGLCQALPGFLFDLKTHNPEKHSSGWFLQTLGRGNDQAKRNKRRL